MRILLHMCCGPCTIFPLKTLQEDGHEVQGYFFNPNIHPFKEFQKRLNTLREYLLAEKVFLIERADYNFEDYIRKVAFHEEERCLLCYEMRLRETADIALKNNFDAFSTTLLVSPYQNHDALKEKEALPIRSPSLYRMAMPEKEQGLDHPLRNGACHQSLL